MEHHVSRRQASLTLSTRMLHAHLHVSPGWPTARRAGQKSEMSISHAHVAPIRLLISCLASSRPNKQQEVIAESFNPLGTTAYVYMAQIHLHTLGEAITTMKTLRTCAAGASCTDAKCHTPLQAKLWQTSVLLGIGPHHACLGSWWPTYLPFHSLYNRERLELVEADSF